ncbi:unnamed protein product, partial [marine sediment metagenome]
LICIGSLDPNKPDEPPMILIGEDEEAVLRTFLDYYETSGYNKIIGYNVSFDLRYLYGLAMKYRVPSPRLFASDIYDVANVMKQVKEEYVYGYNKPGKLDEWAQYLLGTHKTLTYPQMLLAWKDKEYDLLREYNKQDLKITHDLWVLQHLAKGEVELGEETNPVSPMSEHEEGFEKKQCSTCLAENAVPKGLTEWKCTLCGAANDSSAVTL